MNLEFINPVVHEGINVTVRLGDKWKKAFESQNTQVDITGVNGIPVVGHAKILNVAYVKFTDIPQTWLMLEHDPSCRDINGLKAALAKAYGDKFTEDSQVSVVFFKV